MGVMNPLAPHVTKKAFRVSFELPQRFGNWRFFLASGDVRIYL